MKKEKIRDFINKDKIEELVTEVLVRLQQRKDSRQMLEGNFDIEEFMALHTYCKGLADLF